MAEYSVYLYRAMSQSVTVEADSVDEAIERAYADHDLDPNISNVFDADGDVEVYNVSDANGVEVYNADRDGAR